MDTQRATAPLEHCLLPSPPCLRHPWAPASASSEARCSRAPDLATALPSPTPIRGACWPFPWTSVQDLTAYCSLSQSAEWGFEDTLSVSLNPQARREHTLTLTKGTSTSCNRPTPPTSVAPGSCIDIAKADHRSPLGQCQPGLVTGQPPHFPQLYP